MRNIAFGDGPSAANRKSSRLVRALFMALAFGFNLLLLLGAGLYFMDDDDYRHVLIWSAEEFLDSQLEIDGAFSVKFGREVELSAETVHIKANDGSYDLSLGKMSVEQRFASYVSTGTLWINSLHIEELHAEIKETGNGDDFDGQAFSLPFLVIEEIQLRDLSLVYTKLDQRQHSINLSHVSIDDTDNEGPVKVSAAGAINAQTLQLDGTLGSLEQLRSSHRNYPINLTLSRGAVDGDNTSRQYIPVIKLDGNVSNMPSGSILVEANFDVTVPELVPILSTGINADKLGHLQGNVRIAEVGGRWSVRKTRFTATGTDRYQLSIDGAIEDTGQFDLNSEFGVTDPAAFGARFGIDLAGYGPIKGTGSILGNQNQFSYQGKLSIGRIESEAALTTSLAKDKPSVKGKLKVAKLYLADIGINQRVSVPAERMVVASPGTGEQPGAAASTEVTDSSTATNLDSSEQTEPAAQAPVGETSVESSDDADEQPEVRAQAPASDERSTVFGREPIDFTGLQQIDLDLEVLVDQIIGEDFSIDKLAGQIKLDDGALRVTPMRMTFAGGQVDLELVADTRKTPMVSLKVTADDLDLGGVVPHQQEEMQVAGNAQLHVDINSKGRSLDELFANLSGDMNMGLEKVRLPRRYVEYLSGDGPPAPRTNEAFTMLEVDGTIAAKFGTDFDLTAEAVHLRANDGSYDLSLGKMNLQQNIDLYLQKGDWWIDNLSMSDVKVEIVETVAEPKGVGAESATSQVASAEGEPPANKPEDTSSGDPPAEVASAEPGPSEIEPPEHDWHEFDWKVSDWPFVLVEKMQLDNITVVYTQGDETDNYSLSSLVLDNDNSEEPLRLSAAGVVNELALKIEGTVGTPAQPRGKDQVFPVEYNLSSGDVNGTPNKPVMWFKGSIDRTQPVGSRIEGKFDVAVSELLSIFEPDKPRSKLVAAVQQEKSGEDLGHLQGSVNFSEVDGRWGIKELQVVSSETDLYQLKLDETVDASDKIEISTALEIPDPPAFGEAFGIDLTGYAAYKGKGVLTGNRSQLNYKGQTNIGRNKNELTLAVSLVGGKPTIKGKFSTPNLFLPDIGINTRFVVKEGEVLDPETGKLVAPEDLAPEDEKVENTTPETGKEAAPETEEGSAPEVTGTDTADSLVVFSREPFDFAWLHGFNLELEVVMDHITGVDYTIDRLSAHVNLTDGVLRASPMHLTFEGGTADIDFSLDTRSMPAISLKIFADDLELGKAIADLQGVVPVEGKAHLNVDIKSQGRSQHEMAANLSGDIDFGLEDAKIPKVYIEFLSIDIFGWLARTVTFEDSYTTLHCTISSFAIDQGVAKSNLLVADGPQLSIEGDATLNLGKETINMTLYPTQKQRVAGSTSTIKITGALADPDVDTSTSKAGTAAVVGGALLVPQVVIPVFLVEQLWKRVFSSDESEGCDKIIEEYRAKQQEGEQEKSEQEKTE